MTLKENKQKSQGVLSDANSDDLKTKTVYVYSNIDAREPSAAPALAFMPILPLRAAYSLLQDVKALSHDERLSVSQCATLLNHDDAVSLTHTSPLSMWMDAWDRVGILDSVMAATLGDIGVARKTLNSAQMSFDEVSTRSWPVWGLKVMLEEQRLDLNRHARAGTPYRGFVSCSASIAQCSRHGIDAPLIEWIRVWRSTKTRNTIFASLAGVGCCYRPESISQCEIKIGKDADSIYRIALFSPHMRRSLGQMYVLSGYFSDAGKQSSYAYHPLTRKQIPSIDASNWISGHRLSLTYETDGSHPLGLITNSACRNIGDLDGWHVMGLHIKKGSSGPTDRNPTSVFDVLTSSDFSMAVPGVINSPSMESRAMPGVFPKTWLVDCATATPERSNASTIALCRRTDHYELIVNTWLLRIACHSNLPMHRQHSSFRTAKFDSGSVKHLMHPANDFALMHTSDRYSPPKAYSNFRMPMGSLISSGIKLQGFTDSGHHVSASSIYEAMIADLRECLAAPHTDLNYFMHWLVFDSLTGFLAQIPYRYQVISLNTGLSLSPIPFWSLAAEDEICDSVSRDFGYRMVFGAEDAASYLSGQSLARLSQVVGLEQGLLLRFRATCLESLKASANSLIEKIESHARKNGEANSDQFRTAKSKIEWIKSRV